MTELDTLLAEVAELRAAVAALRSQLQELVTVEAIMRRAVQPPPWRPPRLRVVR